METPLRISFQGSDTSEARTAVATSLLPPLAKYWGGDREAYGLMGVVAGALTLFAMVLTFATTSRRYARYIAVQVWIRHDTKTRYMNEAARLSSRR